MKIVVDAFGGDNAPLEIIKGCEMAVKELGVEILLTGKKEEIEKCANENGISLERMEIKNADDVYLMTDDPAEIRRGRRDTSLAVGLQALADGEGDAFVSAGSTGALVMGSTFIVKRIRGIKRTAIAAVMPSNEGPFILVDSGANAECRPEMLDQFAVMGNIYAKKMFGLENPRVGLVNIGTEPTKGDTLHRESYELMKTKEYNFIGNIEAREIPFGGCDVVVSDGFSGNVVLKMYEGVALAMMKNIKGIFMKNILTKLAALTMKKGITEFKKKMDYTELGGAPLLGYKKPVIKAHGSSNAKAIKNAIRQAVDYTKTGIIEEITSSVSSNNTDDEE